jgi:glucose-6-phosphate dehydrogenase assembly protein OpcA
MSTEATSALSDSKLIWTKASRSSGLDNAVSHVCFSNLIVYTEDPNDVEWITGTVADFVGRHPCRTILILAQPRLPDAKLEVSASTHITQARGAKRDVSCEQITLKASGAVVKEIPSAVQPLLVADLPIYLWWRGVFLNQKALLEHMLSFTDRFIYDGVTWTDLHYTVPQVSECVGKHKERVGFSNFNWSRLRPWREYVAEFFDVGVFEKEIHELSKVRVEYMALPGQEEGYQFRALLFVAWLAVQLEWEPVQGKAGADQALIQFKNQKGEFIDTELVMLSQTSTSSQSIQRIIMETKSDKDACKFTIQRDHQEHLMLMTCCRNGIESVFRKVPHADSNVAELLYRELGRRMRNRVFERSFDMAARLIQLI